jgi:hypothetical protein
MPTGLSTTSTPEIASFKLNSCSIIWLFLTPQEIG